MNTIISGEKAKVLYVDDERPNLTAFRILLRDQYEVLTAENAEEGYRLLREHDIPLVVSDQRMPGVTGTELLARVAADFPDCARMILTGYSDIDAVIDGINRSQIYYYFKKPWNESEVRLTLKNALESVMTRRHLLESERRFRSAFEHAGVGMAHLGPDGAILRVNSRLQEFLSATEAELVGKPIMSWLSIIGADDLADVVRAGSLLSEWEAPFETAGGLRWYRLALTLSVGRNGDSKYLILIVDDLTQRKKAEAELAATVSEWENTFNSVSDVIWILDTEQRIVRSNKRSEALFGLTPGETVSRSCCEIIDCRLSDDSCPFKRMKQTLVREHAELNIGEKDLLISVDPILDPSGTYAGAVCTLSDITIRKQIEEERDMLKERLRQSQKLEAIGSLAGGIAHDFNNLLTPIIGYAEIIERRIVEEDIKKMTQAIAKAALSAKQVTGQLLAFGRKQVLEMKPCDLNEVIGSFQEVMRRIIREDILVDVRLVPGILCVMADKGQLVQILLNLIVNAQDAIDTVGTLTIETSEEVVSAEAARMHPGLVPGTYALLSVSDTGCGMDEETVSHIFEPFFTTKPLGQGTGLGLATVYGIVKQHGGFIYVSSQSGGGSVFRTYLPLHAPSVQSVACSDGVLSGKTCTASGDILIVEDNTMVREMLTDALREAGYTIHVASTPMEALQASQSLPNSFLLLTDMVMPEMSGDELFKELFSSHPGMKVLFISGYPKRAGERGIHLDSHNFMQKPFTIKALLERVHQLI